MACKSLTVLAAAAALGGCAHIEFGHDEEANGLIYFEPKPYLLVQYDANCVPTAAPLMLPANRKTMVFKTGYGAGNLSAVLSNGMIASVGQDSSSGVNEGITAFAALAAVAAAPATRGQKDPEASTAAAACPSAMLYAMSNGIPDFDHGMRVPPAPD
ncbi:MAG: hypothetical protein EOP91_00315 [Lysobacteraceae bacterium]|nr:MAG: hypothetical protein EOP91_00315 [Xanthomonadaceae bacterium]